MKSLLLIFIGLFTFLFSSHKKRTSLEIENLKGKVKSCKQYIHYEKIVKRGAIISDTVKRETSFILKDDSIKREVFNKFNEKGYETEYRDTNINEHPHHGDTSRDYQFSNHWRMIYDSNNKVIEEIHNSRSGTLNSTFLATYKNDNGNERIEGTEILRGDSDIVLYKFTRRGCLRSISRKHFNGKLKDIYEESHNSKGFITYTKHRYFDGTYTTKVKAAYHYDSVDRTYSRKELVRTIYGSNKYKDIYRLDTGGNLVTDVLIAKSSIKRPKKINSESTTRYLYKYMNYDAQGNWLKQIEIKNDTIVTVIEREIEYY